MALSVGGAIYIAVKPLVKIFLNCLMGFILARQNILTVEVVKSVSVLIVNWLMPALIFYNVINCIKGADIGLIGVFVLTNFLYETLGLFFACIAMMFTPNPKYWTGGLLIAGSMTNIGDIPIAYVTTLAGGSLFSSNDAQKGTAYSVIFLTTFIFTFFNLGGYRLIEHDFTSRVKDIEAGKYTPGIPPEPGLLPIWNKLVETFHRLTLKLHRKKTDPAKHDLTPTRESSTRSLEKSSSHEPHCNVLNGAEGNNCLAESNSSTDSSLKNLSLKPTTDLATDLHTKSKLLRKWSISSYCSTSAIPDKPNTLSPQFSPSSAASIPQSILQDLASPIERSRTTGSILISPRKKQSGSISGVSRAFIPGVGTLPSSALMGDDSDDEDSEEIMRRSQPPEDMQTVINVYSKTNQLEKVLSRRKPMPQVVNPDAGELSNDTVDSAPNSTPMTPLNRIATSASVVAIKKKKRSVKHWLIKHKLGFLWEFVSNFMRPPGMALLLSITFTMIPWTRRLFYQEEGYNNHGIPAAPDGRAPLGFIMDFTSFVGNAEVPLGLATLGATISRLSLKGLPKGFWKSVVLMTVLKMVVLPIIAIAWADKMRSLGWIDKDNHIAIFVMIISAGVPSATSQVYLTAIYTDSKSEEHEEMDCLAANLIAQYSSILFTMTILVTYTLKKVIQF